VSDVWATDVQISQPVPPENPILVEFGGMGFTAGGMAHNLTESDREELFRPTFAPPIQQP
jgi:hypothetical protein